jgi:hypothetical protein
MFYGLSLAGCAAYRSSVSLEGDLEELVPSLAADNASEEALAALAGGQ